MDLSWNLTVNGSWYTYLGVIMSVPICRMNSCSMPPTLFGMINICGFRFLLLAAHYSADPCQCLHLDHHMRRRESQEDIHCSCWGHPHYPCDSQTGLFSDMVTYKANFTSHQFLWLLIRVRDKSFTSIIPQPELGVEDLFLKMRKIFCFYYCDFIFLFQSW